MRKRIRGRTLHSPTQSKLSAPTAAGQLSGYVTPLGAAPRSDRDSLRSAVADICRPVYFVFQNGGYAVTHDASVQIGGGEPRPDALRLAGFSGPLLPEHLGDPTFCDDHGIRYAYMTGSMANGIASVELVDAVARAGMLSFFGAAGKTVAQVTEAVERLKASLGELPFGFNLIHSPHEPATEAGVVELYLQSGIRLVEASAYLDITLPVVRYRVHGIHRDAEGKVVAPCAIVAKASRIEVATKWFSPPPEAMLARLVKSGDITAEQAELAQQIPLAQDLTAEADSGGHTDNRPALTMLPTFLALRDRLRRQYGYTMPLRVGAAGGIATPQAAAAAFAMGAAYVVTGSINQACVESGSSDTVRKMLAEAQQADITMAPAADMFEMGVKLQVLKRGTMFAMRAGKLFELYRQCGSIDEIPAKDLQMLEKTVFRAPLAEIWDKTVRFFSERDPSQIERAERDGKHKMALIFRWYLGLSSRWANLGEPTRQMDYQVWCGPAMGAFNEWVKGSSLESPENRHVVSVAQNLLYGTAVATRVGHLRSQGIRLSDDVSRVVPIEPEQLEEYFH